jgi:hypothetical protein
LAITNITSITAKNCIIDELHVRRSTTGIDLTSAKNPWQNDTYFLAKFMNNLEAGNVLNEGIPIDKFVIKRRKVGELTTSTLSNIDFISGNMEYTDYTQGIGNYVYSIVPLGINGLEGQPNEITAESVFVGYYLVDKNTGNVQPFDKFMDSEPSVELGLTQGRVEVETFSRFPTVFYTDAEYHRFSLSTVIVADDFSNTGVKYNDFLNKFIRNHRPFIIKSGSGEVYICEVSKPKKSAPLNAWDGRDYFEITIDCLEINDYESFMKG